MGGGLMQLVATIDYAITYTDGSITNEISSGPITNADESASIYRSFRPALDSTWTTVNPEWSVGFKTTTVQRRDIETILDEELMLVNNTTKEPHFFRALYTNNATRNLSADGTQRYEVVGSPNEYIRYAEIDFKTLSSDRQVRNVRVYAQDVSDTSSTSSNNSSIKLLQSIFGN